MKSIPTTWHVLFLVTCLAMPAGAQIDSDFVLSIANPVVAGNTLTIDVSLENAGGDVQGFNIDICHDESILDALSITPGPELQAMNGGSGPEFDQPYPDAEGGVAYGAVFSFSGLEVLPIGTYPQLFQVSYEILDPLADDVELCFCDIPVCPSCPVAVTEIVVGGQSLNPELTCFPIPLSGGFIRGDANGDGLIDIADPIHTLSNLFADGPEPSCLEAANANDDAGIDIGDALYLLNFINGVGSPPPAPFPSCGADADSLGCDVYESCV